MEMRNCPLGDFLPLARPLLHPLIRGQVRLEIDGRGIGVPYSAFLADYPVEHLFIAIKAGNSVTMKGNLQYIAYPI